MQYSENKQTDTTMISIGNLQITLASFLTLLSGFIISVLILLVIENGFVVSVSTFLIFCVISYNINCIQLGHCHTFAWILTFLYIGYAAMFAILFFTNKQKLRNKLKMKYKK